MSVYTKATEEIQEILSLYKLKGETIFIGEPILFQNKRYREVLFNKNGKQQLQEARAGYLYLDEENKIISGGQIIEQLARSMYFYEIFFDEENKNGIYTAIQSQGAIKKDEEELSKLIVELELFYDKESPELKEVREVLCDILKFRQRGNEKLKELQALAHRYKEEMIPLDNEKMDELEAVYSEILRVNFEKVKRMAAIENNYRDIRDSAKKQRRKFVNWFNSKKKNSLQRVSFAMAYYARVVDTYSAVIDMSTAQYMKYLRDLEKRKVKERVELIRHKK